jgi:hypothetical protein
MSRRALTKPKITPWKELGVTCTMTTNVVTRAWFRNIGEVIEVRISTVFSGASDATDVSYTFAQPFRSSNVAGEFGGIVRVLAYDSSAGVMHEASGACSGGAVQLACRLTSSAYTQHTPYNNATPFTPAAGDTISVHVQLLPFGRPPY